MRSDASLLCWAIILSSLFTYLTFCFILSSMFSFTFFILHISFSYLNLSVSRIFIFDRMIKQILHARTDNLCIRMNYRFYIKSVSSQVAILITIKEKWLTSLLFIYIVTCINLSDTISYLWKNLILNISSLRLLLLSIC